MAPFSDLESRLGGASLVPYTASEPLQRMFASPTLTLQDSSYAIEGVLGEGAQGSALLLADTEGKLYVGKLCPVPLNLLGVLPQTADVVREVAALKLLDHPAIPHLYGTFSLSARDSLVLRDFVPGKTLQELLVIGPRSEPEVRQYLADVLEILTYLHSVVPSGQTKPLIHRDIKPSNVIIQPDGHARLTDFGATRVHDRTTIATSIGTPFYQPPEQAFGDAVVQSDLYSLCATAVHALLGGEQLPSDFFNHKLLPSQPYHISPSVPVSCELRSLLERGLAFDPLQRPENAQEMLTALTSPPAVQSVPVTEIDEDLEGKIYRLEQKWFPPRRVIDALRNLPQAAQLFRPEFDHRVAREYFDSVFASECPSGTFSHWNYYGRFHGLTGHASSFLIYTQNDCVIHCSFVRNDFGRFAISFNGEGGNDFSAFVENIRERFYLKRYIYNCDSGVPPGKASFLRGFSNFLLELPATAAVLEAMLAPPEYHTDLVEGAANLLSSGTPGARAPYMAAQRVVDLFEKHRRYSIGELRNILDRTGCKLSVHRLFQPMIVREIGDKQEGYILREGNYYVSKKPDIKTGEILLKTLYALTKCTNGGSYDKSN